MLKWALHWLESRGRKLIIMDRDRQEEYLQRWYLLWPDSVGRERKDIICNVLLHRFMRSDDPVFHDHPWNWYQTIILKGGYFEHTPWGTFWRGPGHTHFVNCLSWRPLVDNGIDSPGPQLKANLHWVEIPKPGETWTLFIRGRTVQDWGFVPNINNGIHIKWDKFLNEQST